LYTNFCVYRSGHKNEILSFHTDLVNFAISLKLQLEAHKGHSEVILPRIEAPLIKDGHVLA